MRTKFKQWAVDYLGEHPEIILPKIDVESDFFKKPISLEVGSGKGDFILNFSSVHLDTNFIAIERVESVAGMMAKKLVDAKAENVLVFPFDARIAFEQLPENYVQAIYLNFVDPWPKKRHAKRRLTYKSFLQQYYRVLKSGGYLFFKSDNDGLYEFTMEEIKESKFTLVSSEPEYMFNESNDAMTEYERKFRDLGHPIHRIVLKK